MENSQLENHIKRFLLGKLSEKEEVALLEWVKQSPENKTYFYKLQENLESEIKMQPEKPTSKSWNKLQNRIQPQTEKRSPFTRKLEKYYRYSAPVAAAFVIGFFISALLIWNLKKPAETAVVQQKISTPYGARTQFVLPDSSIVWLNSGSEILFPSQFKNERPVQLTGEAFFEVKKAESPFIVKTDYGEVEVKGTTFNVKAYKDDLFETTLVSGTVEVVTRNKKEAELRPGYQALYSEGELAVNKVNTTLYTSWTEGKLFFRDEPLPRLASRLERWYNIKIELDDDPRLEEIKYNGTIEMETFMEVLNLISVTAPVDYTWNDQTRIIKLFFKEKN